MTDSDRRTDLFDRANLPDQNHEYVAWVDIMGTKSLIENLESDKLPSTNVYQLHAEVIRSLETELSGQDHRDEFALYPMGDGVFITCNDDVYTLLRFLRSVFSNLAEDIVISFNRGRLDILFTPIVKGVVAYGSLYHGDALGEDEFPDSDYADRVIIGDALVKTITQEREVPPFGISVHRSARPEDVDETWNWWQEEWLAEDLADVLFEYFEYCKRNAAALGYPVERIQEHERRVAEYMHPE